MLGFFFSLAIIGVVALFFALKTPHKAPFLGAHKTRANVLLRYGGFCVVCLLLAALAARGESVLRDIYVIQRGYEDLPERLAAVGAEIETFSE